MAAQDPTRSLTFPPDRTDHSLNIPPEREDASPLRRRERYDNSVLEDLYLAIVELTAALSEFRDSMQMEMWSRQYGPNRQSDARRMRPTTPLGQEPADPDIGKA